MKRCMTAVVMSALAIISVAYGADQVTDLAVFHRNGQTFLSWKEVNALDGEMKVAEAKLDNDGQTVRPPFSMAWPQPEAVCMFRCKMANCTVLGRNDAMLKKGHCDINL